MTPELKKQTLETVRTQIESELITDRNTIDLLLEDPSIAAYDTSKGISYAVHEVLHHMATHKVALDLIHELLEEYTQ